MAYRPPSPITVVDMVYRNFCIVTRRTGAKAYDIPATINSLYHGRYAGTYRSDAISLCVDSLERVRTGAPAMEVELFEVSWYVGPISDPVIPIRMNNAGWWHAYGIEVPMHVFDNETYVIRDQQELEAAAAESLAEIAAGHILENFSLSDDDSLEGLMDDEIQTWIIEDSDEELL